MTKSIALTGFAAVLLLGIGTAQAALFTNGTASHGTTQDGAPRPRIVAVELPAAR